MTSEAVLPLSLLLTACAVTAFVGAVNLAINVQVQRLISGNPKEWFSPTNILRRRQFIHDLLAPAFVAFLAAIACNMGTSLLIEDRPSGWELFASSGFRWLLAGAGLLCFSMLILASLPRRNAMQIATSFEGLLHLARDAENPVAIELLEARFSEVLRGFPSAKLLDADSAFHVPATLVGLKPRWWDASIKDGSELIRPTTGVAFRWILAYDKVALLFIAASSLIPIVGFTWAIIQFGQPAVIVAAISAPPEVVGVLMMVSAAKHDLTWNSRSFAEETMFKDHLQALLGSGRKARTADRLPILQNLNGAVMQFQMTSYGLIVPVGGREACPATGCIHRLPASPNLWL